MATGGASVLVDLGDGLTETTAAAADGTWHVDFLNLPTATYTVDATQTVAGTGSEAATPTTFSIKAGDPVVVTAPAVGTTVTVASDTSPVSVGISGSAQPGATVTVDLGAAGTKTAVAGSDGTWSVTATDLLPDTYTASVTQTFGGSTSAPATRSFVVAAAGTGFAVQAPIDGSTILVADASGTQSIPVSGEGEPFATVQVTLGTATKTVQVALNGTWSTSFPAIGVGSHTIRSTETLNGSTAGPIDRTITISAADPVTITAPADDSTTVVAGPAATSDVTVSGHAAAGADIAIDLGDGHTGTATATGAGAWSIPLTGLPVGTYTIAATQTVDGTTSAPVTSAFSIVAGAPVVIVAPVDGSRVTVADGDALATLPVSGNGQPGADIVVSVGGRTAPATVLADGTWSTTVAGVPVGDQTVSVVQTVGATTSLPVTAAVKVAPGAPVTIAAPAANENVPVADTTSRTDIPASGTSQPGAELTLTLNGAAAGTTTADASGNWSTTLTDVGPGSYVLRATQTVDATTSVPVARSFNVVLADAVTIDSPSTGATYVVARDTSTTSVTVTGTAEPGATVTGQLGGGIAASGTADADGNYSLTLESVPTGPQTISVKETVNGTTSPTAVAVDVVVKAADPIVLSAPVAGVPVGVSTAGSTADVPIAGTAQPGASVSVDLGGDLTAAATAGQDGAWSTVVENVPVGDHTISVTQLVDGHPTSPVTQDLVVRVAAPVAIAVPADGSELAVALPTGTRSVTSGSAEPNTEVRVSLDGGTPVVVTSTAAGAWTTPAFAGVEVGSHTISARELLADVLTPAVESDFVVAVAPAAAITTPQSGQVVQVATGQTASVPVSGTGSPGASVSVVLDGDTAGTVTAVVAADGSWSTPSFSGLVAGGHALVATQSVNGVLQAPVSVDFSVVQTANPVDPVVVGSPTAGAVVPDVDGDGLVDIPVSGTGEPQSTITVSAGPDSSSTTTVGEDGTWSTTVGDVPVGSVTIVVTQTTGGDVTGSDSVQVTAATVTPATITAPTPGTPIAVSDSTATADVTVSGTGQKGAAITVSLGVGLTATATVGTDGTWSVTADDVPAGDRTISVVETSNGAILPAVTQPLRIVVAQPVVVTRPADGATVTVPTSTSTTTIPVSGSAQPGAVVSIVLDGGTPKQVTTDSDGTWSTSFAGVTPGITRSPPRRHSPTVRPHPSNPA
ncbi:beta strand repeat-containing protein [Frondihabitans sucicola]|nr:hypothetical protein [Frondihabitans sucicola]